MDISDGLVEDLGKLCKASGVGAVVCSDAVPTDAFLRHAYLDDWLLLALSGGEDYELLFTAPPNVMDNLVNDTEATATDIGYIVAQPQEVIVLGPSGVPVPIEQRGWEHFRKA